MGRIAFVVVLLGLLGLGAGILYLGAFPPEPQTRPVVKVLPNERFQRSP
ncbi:MAG: hypothetical protein J0H91_10505 [Rhodospirillales bacterium]|nr:hypothetical protein [Rhodospirillales bacterium]